MNSGEETISGLRRVKYLVLDEADRLLSNSFGSDLQRCFDVLPTSDKRQTLLFTATITDAVRALKEKPPTPGKPPVFMQKLKQLIRWLYRQHYKYRMCLFLLTSKSIFE